MLDNPKARAVNCRCYYVTDDGTQSITYLPQVNLEINTTVKDLVASIVLEQTFWTSGEIDQKTPINCLLRVWPEVTLEDIKFTVDEGLSDPEWTSLNKCDFIETINEEEAPSEISSCKIWHAPPHSEVRVIIAYNQALEYQEERGWIRFRLPATISPPNMESCYEVVGTSSGFDGDQRLSVNVNLLMRIGFIMQVRTPSHCVDAPARNPLLAFYPSNVPTDPNDDQHVSRSSISMNMKGASLDKDFIVEVFIKKHSEGKENIPPVAEKTDVERRLACSIPGSRSSPYVSKARSQRAVGKELQTGQSKQPSSPGASNVADFSSRPCWHNPPPSLGSSYVSAGTSRTGNPAYESIEDSCLLPGPTGPWGKATPACGSVKTLVHGKEQAEYPELPGSPANSKQPAPADDSQKQARLNGTRESSCPTIASKILPIRNGQDTLPQDSWECIEHQETQTEGQGDPTGAQTSLQSTRGRNGTPSLAGTRRAGGSISSDRGGKRQRLATTHNSGKSKWAKPVKQAEPEQSENSASSGNVTVEDHLLGKLDRRQCIREGGWQQDRVPWELMGMTDDWHVAASFVAPENEKYLATAIVLEYLEKKLPHRQQDWIRIAVPARELMKTKKAKTALSDNPGLAKSMVS